MDLRSAFILRVTELCDRENLTFYELAKRAGLPGSTLKSALDPERGNPGLKTAGAIFEGLRVSKPEKLHFSERNLTIAKKAVKTPALLIYCGRTRTGDPCGPGQRYTVIYRGEK